MEQPPSPVAPEVTSPLVPNVTNGAHHQEEGSASKESSSGVKSDSESEYEDVGAVVDDEEDGEYIAKSSATKRKKGRASERQGRSRLQQSRKGHSPLEHDRFIDGTLGAYRDLVRSYISVWPLEGDVTDDIVDSIVSQRLLTKTAYDYVVRHGKTLTKPINSGNADSPSREKLRGVESALHAMGLAAHGLVAALTSYRNELEREADLIGQNLCDMKQ